MRHFEVENRFLVLWENEWQILCGAFLVWHSSVLTPINLPYIGITIKQKCCELVL